MSGRGASLGHRASHDPIRWGRRRAGRDLRLRVHRQGTHQGRPRWEPVGLGARDVARGRRRRHSGGCVLPLAGTRMMCRRFHRAIATAATLALLPTAVHAHVVNTGFVNPRSLRRPHPVFGCPKVSKNFTNRCAISPIVHIILLIFTSVLQVARNVLTLCSTSERLGVIPSSSTFFP